MATSCQVKFTRGMSCDISYRNPRQRSFRVIVIQASKVRDLTSAVPNITPWSHLRLSETKLHPSSMKHQNVSQLDSKPERIIHGFIHSCQDYPIHLDIVRCSRSRLELVHKWFDCGVPLKSQCVHRVRCQASIGSLASESGNESELGSSVLERVEDETGEWIGKHFLD